MTATVDNDSQLNGAEPTEASPAPVPGTGKLMRRLRFLVLCALTVAAGLMVARLAVGFFQPHLYAGTVLQSPAPAPPLDGLAFADGEAADLSAFDGDVVLMYFGYTNCPDVCPTTLATAAQAKADLPAEDAERVQLVMVSVDPERDTVDRLQDYVGFFDEDFLALGGDVESIDRAAARFGVYYYLHEPDADGDYTVDHTGSLLGIGPDGHLRIFWGPDTDGVSLRADLAELLDS